jgi:hypothetical protein
MSLRSKAMTPSSAGGTLTGAGLPRVRQTEQMPDVHSVRNDLGGYVVGNVVQAGVVTVAAPASRPIAIAGLPAQPVFVGRERELAQLVDALEPRAATGDVPPAVVVCSVGGLPGVGKTALAVRAARGCDSVIWFWFWPVFRDRSRPLAGQTA